MKKLYSTGLIAAADILLSVSSLYVTPRCPCGYQVVAGDAHQRCGVEIGQRRGWG
jgi:hypothetical protein